MRIDTGQGPGSGAGCTAGLAGAPGVVVLTSGIIRCQIPARPEYEMSKPKPFYTDPREARVWIRGIFQLPSGRQITRTLQRDFILQPGDDERPAIMINDLWEELQAAGYDFPEGHGTRVEFPSSMSGLA